MCSLILLVSCQQTSPESSTPPPVHSVDGGGLHSAIRSSEQPYVLVNFWATFCKPCKGEIPDLVKVQHDTSLGVKVLLVSMDDFETEQIARLGKHLQPLGVDFASLHMNPQEAFRFIEGHYPGWNSTIPLNFVFSNEGRLITQTGLTDHSEVMMIVNKDRRFD